LQGQPVVYYSNFEAVDKQHIASQVMNFMQYDAAAVGNHDIEAGHDVYDKLVKEFKFPWLAANAINTKTGKSYFKPYTIIKRQGVKIAVLGMITPWVPNWLPENLWTGIEFQDMVECAQYWVPYIQKKEKPDILIGLFHSGVDYTYGGLDENTPKNENASELVAQEVPGFDIIFVGHDHQGWNKKLDNGVLIMGSLNAAKTVAKATVEMEWNAEKKMWEKNVSGEIIDVKTLPISETFMNQFKSVVQEVKDYVSKKIGSITESISTRDSMFGDSPFVDLIHTIQLEITGADVSFAAPLSFDKTIEKGDLYVRDMFKLYQYENLLYTMELSGKEIRDFLEYSYALWFKTMKDENDHLINFKLDDKGNIVYSNGLAQTVSRYYNYDSAAGIIYAVDVSKPVGQRITIKSMADGSPFDMNKKYKVAINSYRGTGGGGHITKGAGIAKEDLEKRMLSSTVKDLRYYLMKWIEKKGIVEPQTLGSWTVIPETWWLKGKQKDYAILYPTK